MIQKKMRVAVLFGGRSSEHEISIQSAASVISALDKEKYKVIPVYITKDGKWLAGLAPQKIPSNKRGVPVALLADPSQRKLISIENDSSFEIDVIFPLLHGTFGEDGTVQGLFELANIPYVGAGVLSSTLGMDKVLMKTVFAQAGLPQPNFWYCLRKDIEKNQKAVIEEIEKRFVYPCFVKPANLGSSVGISKAHDRKELLAALNLATKYDRKVIIEEYIDAREIEVSVLGNEEPTASLPGEIIPLKEFYDYEAKYIDGLSQLIIPARLHLDTVKTLKEYAIRAYKALDCAGMARVDFFLKRDKEVLVNEVNTIPGFTRFSMYPKLWEASGIGFQELLDHLISLALEHHEEKNRTTYCL